MKIEILKNKIIIKRNNDKKIYNESILYFKIKEKLNKRGFNLIKKLIHKDGHMMGGPRDYYLRDRKWNFVLLIMITKLELYMKTTIIMKILFYLNIILIEVKQ